MSTTSMKASSHASMKVVEVVEASTEALEVFTEESMEDPLESSTEASKGDAFEASESAVNFSTTSTENASTESPPASIEV